MRTAIETGRLKKGDTLLIASVGAGFTSGASLIKWAF
jgi:3-oxoacyl-[acyl-carrier-protein] synthase-3